MRRSLFELDPEFYPIACTGAPGSGKSTSITEVAKMIERAGIGIARVMPEVATEMMQAGFSLNPEVWSRPLAASEELFLSVYEREERYYSMMKNLRSEGKPLILLIDRPLRDLWTYIGRQRYLEVLAKFGFDPHQLLSRYKAVLHFVTPALKEELAEHYTTANNSTRSESAQGSRDLDAPTFESWKGHPHHLIVNPTKTPQEKIVNAFILMRRVLPMAKEIERKWQLLGFDENLIPKEASVSEIVQDYLVEDPSMPGVERRVRKEVQDGSATYHRTWKVSTENSIERDEDDPIITLAEYEYLLCEADPSRSTILKRRYRLRHEDRIIETDKYHGIPDLYLTEVEFPTKDESAQFELPEPFLSHAFSRDGDKRFKNSNIALLLKQGRTGELFV